MKIINLIGMLSAVFLLISILSAIIGWDIDYVRYPFETISLVGILLSIISVTIYLILHLILYFRRK